MAGLNYIFSYVSFRLLNKIYNKVTNDLAGSTLKKFLFNWAIASKESDRKK